MTSQQHSPPTVKLFVLFMLLVLAVAFMGARYMAVAQKLAAIQRENSIRLEQPSLADDTVTLLVEMANTRIHRAYLYGVTDYHDVFTAVAAGKFGHPPAVNLVSQTMAHNKSNRLEQLSIPLP